MANWVTSHCEELLIKINEVPYTDTRERQQLSILMKGVSEINSMAMDKVATKTRTQMRGWTLEAAEEEKKAAKKASRADEPVDELTRLRPIR